MADLKNKTVPELIYYFARKHVISKSLAETYTDLHLTLNQANFGAVEKADLVRHYLYDSDFSHELKKVIAVENQNCYASPCWQWETYSYEELELNSAIRGLDYDTYVSATKNPNIDEKVIENFLKHSSYQGHHLMNLLINALDKDLFTMELIHKLYVKRYPYLLQDETVFNLARYKLNLPDVPDSWIEKIIG